MFFMGFGPVDHGVWATALQLGISARSFSPDRSRPRATLQRNLELRSSLPGMSALELLAGRGNSGNGLSTRFESDYFGRHLVSRS
jgi:hypothetical protein